MAQTYDSSHLSSLKVITCVTRGGESAEQLCVVRLLACLCGFLWVLGLQAYLILHLDYLPLLTPIAIATEPRRRARDRRVQKRIRQSERKSTLRRHTGTQRGAHRCYSSLITDICSKDTLSLQYIRSKARLRGDGAVGVLDVLDHGSTRLTPQIQARDSLHSLIAMTIEEDLASVMCWAYYCYTVSITAPASDC